MDLQKFADGFFPPTCIVSVEKKGNGGYGDIRLAAANKKYLDIIDIRIKNLCSMLHPMWELLLSRILFTPDIFRRTAALRKFASMLPC